MKYQQNIRLLKKLLKKEKYKIKLFVGERNEKNEC